jgi:hypothetical protein
MKLLQILLMVGVAMQANKPANSRPDVPDAIKAPAGEEVVLKVHATGAQIYVCRQETDGKFSWALKAPEAELRDDQGGLIGRHYAGPSWTHNDGSTITGKATAKVEYPDSIPWLLVAVNGHSGSDGVLSRVTTIQRIHTQGGQAPSSGCSADALNHEVKSSYSADYYFYAPANSK